MHSRWIGAIASETHWDLMQFNDESGYGDVDYFAEAIRSSADISRSGLYLMLFAQFEADVNRRCANLIKQHKDKEVWHERRVWEALDEKNVSSIPFARRLSLLINKGRPIYAAIQKLYLERNLIAHGAKSSLDVDMSDAIETIEAVVAAMEENP
jgi:hypothetical protein